uniref:Plasma membrane ATPase n=1 Tax=Chromera velia CCMP2878 TaxID=1169474 RepID=A0A0G4HGL1_9ALVE|eukprot:Cvel_27234.t1-p1 / transcript=Cvel_27234.t1 / gene=Cvel_27234 / organism=Chromera_velia_CCMP2878 / gene_product=Plasma membrane ATPase 1, putative / transcript_product=Plasma membrane ATPase 1, putative / location=Cvel_scaffold3370:2026-14406(-) / protein_length=1041 / sequence_SO=supercontig / SO=protein_coding / is_pseudo=false
MSKTEPEGPRGHSPSNPDITKVNPGGLSDADVERIRGTYGFNEVIAKETPEWIVFLWRFWGSTPLILLATGIIAVSVESVEIDTNGNETRSRDWVSFGVVTFMLFLTVIASHLSDRSAKSAIAAVKALSTPECPGRRNGEVCNIKVRELVPGDVCILRPGSVIPADGRVIGKGTPLLVDEAALTGESLPVTKKPGDDLLSGAVIQKGELDMVVTAIGENSFYGKTLALLGNAQPQGHLKMVLAKASLIITLIGAVFCTILWIVYVTTQTEGTVDDWFLGLKLSIAILSSVIPAAMPVVTATVLAVGSQEIAKEKALVQRLSAIEEMAGMEILCSDKTGTLTKNILELNPNEIVAEPGYSNADVLLYAALASNLEHPEPIDKAVTSVADMGRHKTFKVEEMIPFDPVNKKVISTVVDRNGNRMRVLKGAPHIIMHLTANDPTDEARQEQIINGKASRGLRTLGVAIEQSPPVDPQDVHDVGVCKLVGYISLFDPPRDDTKETIELAKALGVEVKMITGDQQAIGIETAKMLGMGINICGQDVWKVDTNTKPFLNAPDFTEFCRSVNGFAGVYPEHKFKVVEALMKHGDLIGMTGDGVNDAPALKLSTVGIAVAGATEAAKGAADITLLEPGLRTIVTAIMLSRQIYRRIEAYIMYRISSSIFLQLVFWLGIVAFKFQMPTFVVLIISGINDITIMACSKDNVPTAEKPLHWDMLKTVYIGLIIGCGSTIASIIVLGLVDPESGTQIWWGGFGLDELANDPVGKGQVVCTMFIVIGLLIEYNYMLCRARKLWFIWDEHTTCKPHIIVIIPVVAACLLEIFLCVYWPKNGSFGGGGFMSGLAIDQGQGVAWIQVIILAIYCYLWAQVIDGFKWLFYVIYDGKEAGTWGLSQEQLDAKQRLADMKVKKHTEMVTRQGLDQHIQDQRQQINAEIRRQSASNLGHVGGGFAAAPGPDGGIMQLSSFSHNQRQQAMAAARAGSGLPGGQPDAVTQKRIASLEKTLADQQAAAKAMDEKMASMEAKIAQLLELASERVAANELLAELGQ